jgi:DNA-binding transcriptional ArsR family regulator
MESSFAIIAEPNRRAILSLLVSSERSVGEIERQLRMPQTSVSKHLRVLREAGFVESRVDAQRASIGSGRAAHGGRCLARSFPALLDGPR